LGRVSWLVSNTSAYLVFNGIALSSDGASLAVTTTRTAGTGLQPDSARASNVFRYDASTGALLGQVTANSDTTLARSVSYARPVYTSGTMMFERSENNSANTQL